MHLQAVDLKEAIQPMAGNNRICKAYGGWVVVFGEEMDEGQWLFPAPKRHHKFLEFLGCHVACILCRKVDRVPVKHQGEIQGSEGARRGSKQEGNEEVPTHFSEIVGMV